MRRKRFGLKHLQAKEQIVRSVPMYMNTGKQIREALLATPEAGLASSMRAIVQGWSEDPTPLEVLDLLDRCLESETPACSRLTYLVLELLFGTLCREHRVSPVSVIFAAPWRPQIQA